MIQRTMVKKVFRKRQVEYLEILRFEIVFSIILKTILSYFEKSIIN